MPSPSDEALSGRPAVLSAQVNLFQAGSPRHRQPWSSPRKIWQTDRECYLLGWAKPS